MAVTVACFLGAGARQTAHDAHPQQGGGGAAARSEEAGSIISILIVGVSAQGVVL